MDEKSKFTVIEEEDDEETQRSEILDRLDEFGCLVTEALIFGMAKAAIWLGQAVLRDKNK